MTSTSAINRGRELAIALRGRGQCRDVISQQAAPA